MQTLMNWAVTVAGGMYMACIIAMANRFAVALPVVAKRRRWLLAGVTFLTSACLLASSGLYYSGPAQVATSPLGWVISGMVVVTVYPVLFAWMKQLLSQRSLTGA